MRLELNLKYIAAENPVAQKLLVKVIINGSIEFKSDWADRRKDNIFPFFEKNTITLDDSQLNYIKFQIGNQSRFIVAQKTVLNSEVVALCLMQKHNTEIDFKIKNDRVVLKYHLIQVVSDQEISTSFKRKLTIEEEPEIMKNTEGKLEILKLGSNAYNFSQRLDPVIWLVSEAEQIFSWRKPGLTIGFGIILTLIIMNLKISLLLGTLFLIFGKNILIKKIQKINKKKNVHKRIFVPKENTVFLQTSMTTYTLVYEKIHDFCLNQDKTDVINLIHHICQASFIAFILLFVISLQKLIVVVLWGLILLASPSGIKLFKEIWPSFLYLQKQTSKVTDVLSSYFKIVNRQSVEENSVIKEFYFYEYQRWFMGKGWSKPLGLLQYHFADQTGKIQLFPKTLVPQNWQWLTDHQVNYMETADHNGYEYTNELSKTFSSKCSFATVRRRKFIRKCRLQIDKDKKSQ